MIVVAIRPTSEFTAMLYEERRIRLRSDHDFSSYRSWVLEDLWPNLEEQGHRPLCLLNGLIGQGVSDVVLIVGFNDFDHWMNAQHQIAGVSSASPPRNWIQDEDVRLMTASSYRPTETLRSEDRRPVYGMRRWWIHPEDWLEFNRLSFDGVWPAMDHMGHWVLGQFRNVITTDPLGILNLAGYQDPAHWQRTRTPAKHGVPSELLEELRTLGRQRNQLILRSYVCLMTAHWPD